MKLNFIILSLAFGLCSFGALQGQNATNLKQPKSASEKALNLANKAANELQKFRASTRTEADKYHLSRALAFADSAIILDTNSNGFALLGKAEILIVMKDYEGAIRNFELSRSRTVNEPEVVAREGFLYEKIGESKLAQTKFKEALRLYDVLTNETEETKYIIVNRAILFMFISQPAYAKKEYAKAKRRYPHDAYVNAYSDVINNFRKESYLKSIFFE